MYHSFLIHSSADGHLGCFHVLAIINSAAMNIGVHVSLSILSYGFFKYFYSDSLHSSGTPLLCILAILNESSMFLFLFFLFFNMVEFIICKLYLNTAAMKYISWPGLVLVFLYFLGSLSFKKCLSLFMHYSGKFPQYLSLNAFPFLFHNFLFIFFMHVFL